MMSISVPRFSGVLKGPMTIPRSNVPAEPMAKLQRILSEEAKAKSDKAAKLDTPDRWNARGAKAVLSQEFLSYKGARLSGADIFAPIVEMNDMFRGKTDPPTLEFVLKDSSLRRFPKAIANALKALEKARLIKIDSFNKYTPEQVYQAVSRGFEEMFGHFYLVTSSDAKKHLN